MPSLGVSRSHWPVVAWIRLRLPPPPVAILLTPGPPPPPEPPLEALERAPVATDPRKRIFAREDETADGIVRFVWDADDPEFLEAELRLPDYGGRPTPEQVRSFWGAVKVRTSPLGPLTIDGADPIP